MTSRDVSTARSLARTVIQRVVNDAAFGDSLRRDPRATLLDAGFPDWALDDFVTHDLGLDGDVSGYSLDRCAVTSLLWMDDDGMDPQ